MSNGSNGSRPPGEPLIVLGGLKKAYRTPAGDFYALKGIDLEIYPGEFVALLGRSGAGKSTLINMLAGIDRPTAGEIWIAGQAVHKLSEARLTRWRGREVGVVFQSFQLMPMLTCAQNVMLPMDFAGRYGLPRQQYARARELLATVDIAEHADKLPSAVSGGQRQRVAIARALANDPIFIAADEPTGSLDSRTADAVFAVFQQLVAEGKTIFMATHDRELASRVSRVLRIEDGLIVEDLRPAEAQEGRQHVVEMEA
ncbi:MAG: ABC transporter ATP-binding protein [Caldilinea sp.]|nr:ABC transporter ATP-binding protein [Caldilineaceae bacterium]MCB9119691.1 ABC transporter ATP-binding protein [Caldilineaceae bacterium]MCW5843573.1 ABC transporter ATP-binding protein [Caldilinea sp.]